jgi:hypothetical protein
MHAALGKLSLEPRGYNTPSRNRVRKVHILPAARGEMRRCRFESGRCGRQLARLGVTNGCTAKQTLVGRKRNTSHSPVDSKAYHMRQRTAIPAHAYVVRLGVYGHQITGIGGDSN